jgi:hypothetical protein
MARKSMIIDERVTTGGPFLKGFWMINVMS